MFDGRLRGRAKTNEGGQATFEFALVSLGIIFVVLAIVDGALLMYNYIAASSAVRDAARYASVNCGGDCDDGMPVLIRAEGGSGGFMQADDFEATWTGTEKGDSVVVRVKDTYAYNFLFFPVSFGVRACTQMRLEQDEVGAVPVVAGSSCD